MLVLLLCPAKRKTLGISAALSHDCWEETGHGVHKMANIPSG